MTRSADSELWEHVLGHLRHAHPDVCRKWFQDIAPLDIETNVALLRVAEPVQQSYLQHECASFFDEAFQTVTGRLMTVRFLGPDDPFEPRREAPSAASRRAMPETEAESKPVDGGSHHSFEASGNGRVHTGHTPTPAIMPSRAELVGESAGLRINPDYSFENFVIGPENRLAHAAALAVAGHPATAYNPLFIHGGVGLGKTHLLQAICLTFLRNLPGFRIHYTSCEQFSTDFADAVQAGRMNEFRHHFRDEVDCLVIDDVHFLTRLERTQEEFFHTFNTLFQGGQQIVLSSDAPPHEIPDLEARLVSRFQSGLVVQMNPTLYETRIEIVRQKARLRGVDIPDAVAQYIAGRIETNVRELEGAITRIQMQAQIDECAIDVRLARLALDDQAPDVRPEPTISQIIDAVTDHFDVKITELQSRRRHKSIAHPRQVCMYLARKHTRYSLEEIGGYFGGRDHTTVMHAVKTIKHRRDADDEFSRVLDALERQIGAPEFADRSV
ncbi:MAG: chromosomal replication initiator protein DnaA [Planctomycetota bacterium]